MPRVLIVGEAPGRTDGGLTRRRISELSGRPWEEWADWMNLIDEWPGPSRKGSAWNQRAAREAARRLRIDLDRTGRHYNVVVLLGRRVAGAMLPAGAGYPFFRWIERGGDVRMIVIPHTSGIVRWWNDAENVATARRFLTDIARDAGGEESTMSKSATPVSAREAVIAAFRAAERPLTPNEAAAIVMESGVEVAAKGTTPMDYRLSAPVYREAKAGRFYKRAGSGRPAKFALREDAPESDPDLVAKLRARIAQHTAKAATGAAKPDPKKREKAVAKS